MGFQAAKLRLGELILKPWIWNKDPPVTRHVFCNKMKQIGEMQMQNEKGEEKVYSINQSNSWCASQSLSNSALIKLLRSVRERVGRRIANTMGQFRAVRVQSCSVRWKKKEKRKPKFKLLKNNNIWDGTLSCPLNTFSNFYFQVQTWCCWHPRMYV